MFQGWRSYKFNVNYLIVAHKVEITFVPRYLLFIEYLLQRLVNSLTGEHLNHSR